MPQHRAGHLEVMEVNALDSIQWPAHCTFGPPSPPANGAEASEQYRRTHNGRLQGVFCRGMKLDLSQRRCPAVFRVRVRRSEGAKDNT